MSYVTLEELKDILGVNHNNEDAAYQAALDVAEQMVDDYCGRSFSADTTATARVFITDMSGDVYVDDFWTSTGLIIKTDGDGDGAYETTWTATDYRLLPLNARRGNKPWAYTQLAAANDLYFPRTSAPAVEVTAKWGWPAVPEPVKYATRLMAVAVKKRPDAPWGIAGTNEFGSVRVREDPDVAKALGPYVRQEC